MKKLLAIVLLLCMLAPMAAVAEEKLPHVQFPMENYVAYPDYEFYLQLDVKSSGSLKSPKTYELRDETGRVWASKEVKSGWTKYSYKIMLDESHVGGHTLASVVRRHAGEQEQRLCRRDGQAQEGHPACGHHRAVYVPVLRLRVL